MKARIKYVWSDERGAFIFKKKRLFHWKTICVPVDEFDEEPLTADTLGKAEALYAKVSNGDLKGYILR